MIHYCMHYLTRQNVLPIDLDIFISIASWFLVEETWSKYERCYIQLGLNYHWRIQGSGPGGPGSPLIFRPNWGAKGRKILDPALITTYILPHEKFLQFDWLTAVVFQLNLKYLHVKNTNLLRVVFVRDIWHKYHSFGINTTFQNCLKFHSPNGSWNYV